MSGRVVVRTTAQRVNVAPTVQRVQIRSGVRGATGTVGPPGTGTATLGVEVTAATILSGHRAVVPRASDGKVIYADNATPEHLPGPVWLTLGAAVADEDITVLATGEHTEPLWAWTPGEPIFLGANGLLTQTPPTAPGALFLRPLAVATEPTVVYFDPQPPIQLI